MSQRVTISKTLKRLILADLVTYFIKGRRFYEPTEKGITLNYEWMPVLRTCTICGAVAKTHDELKGFAKDSRAKHGRANLCLNCRTEAHRKQKG